MLEVKDGAIKTVRAIDMIDNLNVAPEDMDSFDPLIKLHLYRRLPAHDILDMMKDFAKQYQIPYTMLPAVDISKADTKEKMDGLIKKHVPGYFVLKDKITAKQAREKAAKIRADYKEYFRLVKEGKKIPDELTQRFLDASGEVNGLASETDFFGGMFQDEVFYGITGKFGTKDLSEEELENILAVYEAYVPTVLENVDYIYSHLPDKNLDLRKDAHKEMDRRANVMEKANVVLTAGAVNNPVARQFKLRLNNSKSGEEREKFERQATRLFKGKFFKRQYNDYRKAEEELDKIKNSGSKEEIEAAEKNLAKCEGELINTFMINAAKDLQDALANFDKNFDNSPIGIGLLYLYPCRYDAAISLQCSSSFSSSTT